MESFTKISSLIDYYNKPAKVNKDQIDWAHWSDEIRTAGVVEKIKEKYNTFKKQDYNVDLVAQKSTVTSEKYETYVKTIKIKLLIGIVLAMELPFMDETIHGKCPKSNWSRSYWRY